MSDNGIRKPEAGPGSSVMDYGSSCSKANLVASRWIVWCPRTLDSPHNRLDLFGAHQYKGRSLLTIRGGCSWAKHSPRHKSPATLRTK